MSPRKKKTQLPVVEEVAGNGLLDRRTLLGRGIMIAGAAASGVAGATVAAAEPLQDPPWSRAPGAITPVLQTPSRFEKDVVRTLSNPTGTPRTQHARTPHQLLNGTITPNSLH